MNIETSNKTVLFFPSVQIIKLKYRDFLGSVCVCWGFGVVAWEGGGGNFKGRLHMPYTENYKFYSLFALNSISV